MKNILITGAGGQLATELQRSLPANTRATVLSQSQLDITNANGVHAAVTDVRPDVIINAAAYTAVDRAEDEAALARAVNANGAEYLAAAAAAAGARLVQVSTDYVFDGRQGAPYRPDDPLAPLNVYGLTKLEGEQACLAQLGNKALVIRTAWVYAAAGHNFVKTVLRLCAEKPELRIVDDQLGTPTWAGSLAQMIWQALENGLSGTWHFTDAGVASWYDFAVAIQEIGLELGLLQKAVPVMPISSAQFPQKATRPACSVLDKSATWEALQMQPLHWREALKRMMREL